MRKFFVSALLVVTFAACSGGSGSTDSGGDSTPDPVRPQASTGFAQTGDEISSGINYLPRTAGRLTDASGTIIRADVPITMNFFNSGVFSSNSTTYPQGTLRVTVDDETRNMLRLSPDDNTYIRFTGSGLDYDTRYRITDEAMSEAGLVIAQAGLLEFTDLNGDDLISFVVFGHDTDPATVSEFNAVSGSVSWEGSIRVAGYRNGFYGEGDGLILLTADFDDSNSVTGSMNFATIPNVTYGHNYTLTNGTIAGNGFQAGLDTTGSIGEGQTLLSGSIDGNFYGPNLEAVGGTVQINLLDEEGNDVLLHGGFVAD